MVAVGLLDELDLEPVALDAPPDADADDWPAGATAATFATAAHVAAEFADASPCLYDRKDSAPVLSSWTSAVMLAAYDALASLVVGPARIWVELFSTLMT